MPSPIPSSRRRTSRTPAKKPMPPRMSRKTGLVCSQRSRKYPRSPPTTTAETRTKGSSMAMAAWLETSLAFSAEGDWEGSGLLSEGILGEPRERLRIQPGGEGDKYGDAAGHGLRAGHRWNRGFAGLFEPSVHHDAEVVVKRGDDVENGEDGEHGMVRFNQRKENEILAHEAGRRRDACKREHKDEQQDGSSGTALVEAVQVIELIADEAFLAEHDDDRECTYSHEDVGEQVEGDSSGSRLRQLSSGFVPSEQAEQNVTHVRNRGIREEALDVGLC